MRDAKKRERRRLIESILRQREVGTQVEVLDILSTMGCPSTQTTVARDMVEMGVQKVRGLYGRSRYVLPREEERNPEQSAAGALRAFCTYIDVADNITYVGTRVGAAGTVGTAIDALHHPDIVGTLAGYDGFLVLCRSPEKALAMKAHLDDLRDRPA